MSAESWRLFLALPAPPALHARLAALQDELRAATWELRFTRPEDLHLTLHFLGATPARLVDDLDRELGAVAHATRPFDLACGGLGAFPSLAEPRVVWAGLRGHSQALTSLFQATLRVLNAYRLFKLRDELSPHLTVARVAKLSEAWDARMLEALMPQWEELGPYPVEKIRLMRSIPGSPYEVVSDYPLS